MKQFISDVKKGDTVASYFVLTDKESLRAYNKKLGFWFRITLSDKTGRMPATFWGDRDKIKTQKLFDSLCIGSVVFVRGTASYYHDILYIAINAEDELHQVTEYDKDDLMLVSDIDIGQLKSKFITEINLIQNVSLKSLLNSFFKDELFLEKFTKWPAARSRHHAYLGGLLEHVVSMLDTSKTICQNYPSINADMVKTGCILHDIGKVVQYDMDLSITFTLDGSYIGHLNLGVIMIKEKIKKLRNNGISFDNDLERQILHIVLSHHGKKEYGSPVTPQTPEALLVHLVDTCDAQLNYVIKNLGIKKQNGS